MAPKTAELPQFHLSGSTFAFTPPESLNSFCTDPSASLASLDSSSKLTTALTCNSRIVSSAEFAFEWILKVLGVAAAILFGIWAPVSYNAQSAGNASNDRGQAQLVKKMERLTEEVKELVNVLDVMGALRAWEFCGDESRNTIEACRKVSSTVRIESVVQELASTKRKHKPSSRRTGVPASPTSGTTASVSMPSSGSISHADLISRITSSPVPVTKPGQPTLPSTMIAQSTDSGIAPGLPFTEPTDIVAGHLPRMALSMGFLLGFIMCLGILGGQKVVKMSWPRRRSRLQWGGNEKVRRQQL